MIEFSLRSEKACLHATNPVASKDLRSMLRLSLNEKNSCEVIDLRCGAACKSLKCTESKLGL